MALKPDIRLTDHGSIVILTPISEAAIEHCAEHFPDDGPMWVGGYAIERRYVGPIVDNLTAEGFYVA